MPTGTTRSFWRSAPRCAPPTRGAGSALPDWRPTVTVNTQAGFNRAGRRRDQRADRQRNDAVPQLRKRSVALCRSTQPIYRGGRTEAQTRQAINTVQAARAQTLSVETDRLSGGRHGLSRRRARPDPGRGRPQQRAGAAQAAGSDPRPVPRRRGDPHRRGAGRIRAGAGNRATDHRRGQPRDQPRRLYPSGRPSARPA